MQLIQKCVILALTTIALQQTSAQQWEASGSIGLQRSYATPPKYMPELNVEHSIAKTNWSGSIGIARDFRRWLRLRADAQILSRVPPQTIVLRGAGPTLYLGGAPLNPRYAGFNPAEFADRPNPLYTRFGLSGGAHMRLLTKLRATFVGGPIAWVLLNSAAVESNAAEIGDFVRDLVLEAGVPAESVLYLPRKFGYGFRIGTALHYSLSSSCSLLLSGSYSVDISPHQKNVSASSAASSNFRESHWRTTSLEAGLAFRLPDKPRQSSNSPSQ